MPAGDPSPPAKNGQKKPAQQANLQSLGRYFIQKKVGAGGMGAVYRATDQQLKRTVALKVLPRDKAKNPTLVKRFQSEAQAAAHLRHPNIIGVYDAGEIDGFLYIAMEFVEGIDVADLVARKGVLSPKRSLDIIRQVTLALQHAYEQNIVHRDIKPSNLMIDKEGNVKLADMGLARSLDEEESSSITRDGTTVGTVDYMSPEQARDSKSADCRSDIYSLGATWFHMLCGRPPFHEGDLLNKITAHAQNEPPDPRDLNPDVPDAIAAIIFRMLEKKPQDRYQTPQELLDDLNNANLDQREISLDLLAALGDDDDGGGEQRPARRRRERAAASSAAADVPSIDLLAGLSEEDDDVPAASAAVKRPSGSAVSADPSSAELKGSKKARPKVAPKKKRPSSAETVADRGSTDSVPSAREVMLRRGSRRHAKGGGVSFNPIRLMIVGAAVIGLFIVYSFVKPMFEGSSSPAPSSTNRGDLTPSTNPPPSPPGPPRANGMPSPPRRQ
ncbi:protein kinase [bacterium]|nr:protein kinase [bacterium]